MRVRTCVYLCVWCVCGVHVRFLGRVHAYGELSSIERVCLEHLLAFAELALVR